MEYLRILLSSVASYVVLFILSRIMGKREISQLTMFDYINGITIGSIAAEAATSLENNILLPTLAMVVYAVLTVAVSLMTAKSLKIRRIICGRPIILYDGGKLYDENFRRAKIDISDFLTQCRVNGYFSLDDIQTAILEVNGSISFLPSADTKPLTPQDMKIKVSSSCTETTLIDDGRIMEKNLERSGRDDIWLKKELDKASAKAKDIFLATVDCDNKVRIYKKDGKFRDKELF